MGYRINEKKINNIFCSRLGVYDLAEKILKETIIDLKETYDDVYQALDSNFNHNTYEYDVQRNVIKEYLAPSEWDDENAFNRAKDMFYSDLLECIERLSK